jgi:hypothetical protein
MLIALDLCILLILRSTLSVLRHQLFVINILLHCFAYYIYVMVLYILGRHVTGL